CITVVICSSLSASGGGVLDMVRPQMQNHRSCFSRCFSPHCGPVSKMAARREPEMKSVPKRQDMPPTVKPKGVIILTLTDEERQQRARALSDARLREAEARKKKQEGEAD